MDTQPRPPGGVQTTPGPGVFRDDSGVALLVTVLILLVVSILGTAVVNLGSVDYTLSSNYRSSMVALNLADSGLNAAAAGSYPSVARRRGACESHLRVADASSER